MSGGLKPLNHKSTVLSTRPPPNKTYLAKWIWTRSYKNILCRFVATLYWNLSYHIRLKKSRHLKNCFDQLFFDGVKLFIGSGPGFRDVRYFYS